MTIKRVKATPPGIPNVEVELTPEELTEFNNKIAQHEANLLGRFKDDSKKEIKQEAAKRIESNYPIWKQNNIISDFLSSVSGASAVFHDMKADISTIRSNSDTLEASVDALTSVEQVKSFDVIEEFNQV